jgi:pimeloyl-ACP methyl ester carboxylesterase
MAGARDEVPGRGAGRAAPPEPEPAKSGQGGDRAPSPSSGPPEDVGGVVREVTLHGHTVCYRIAGEGPVIGLIHGITETQEVWRDVIPRLARHYTVIAGDLLGHGQSAKPRGDYSLGAYASGLRDLMGALGFERGTVVGRSLGGGVALQFAYQFPEYTERLVLVASGGLGREVHPLLRAASLPGSELVLPWIVPQWAVRAGEAVGRAFDRLGLKAGPDLAEMARGYGSLVDAGAREAFIHTLRAVVDHGGQRVSALDRLYLAEDLPTLIIWGTEDPIIPVEHGRVAHELMPGSTLVEIEGSGHWPQLDQPERFTEALVEFIESTEPYEFDLERMREQLRRGAPAPGGGAETEAGPVAQRIR